ncbi:MAG: hypothetical protein ACJ768_07370 [Gaiellaceae bacterium]
MTTLFLDLIQDLREKRLWPVAVALLAATAAVPLVLLKPADTGSSNAPQIASNSSAEGLPVVNVKDGSSQSKLDEYETKNPFKPIGQLKSGPGGTSAGSSSAGGSGGSAGSGSGGSGAGGASGSGGSGGPGGGATGGTPSGGGSPVSSDRKYFAFHVDVKFGPRGHAKSYKDVKQMSMLPDDKSPVIVFMGMSADFKTAIFLVDTSKYEAAGEGKCRPSPTTCSFVELNLHDSGNEETLAAPDGSSEYTLELTAIKRVFLTPDEAKGDAQDQNTPVTPKGKARAKAAVATGGKARADVPNPLSQLFELPSFAVQG